MRLPKLLQFLLFAYCPGIVQAGGGGSADDHEDDGDDSLPGTEGEGDGDGEELPLDDADDATGEGDAEGGEGEADEEGLVLSLGEDEAANDEDDQEDLTPKARKRWAEMRIQLRQEKTARREAEQRLAAAAPVAAAVSTLGPEPTMEDEDVDFDADKFKVKYKAWIDTKVKADQVEETTKQAQRQQQTQWETRLSAVDKAASSMKFRAAEDANEVFDEVFSVMQRGIILDTPDDPKTSAMLRQVLGANPAIAKKLAAIQHPGKFIFALKDIVDKMKTAPRRTAPVPEREVKSSTTGAAAVDSQIERLRGEARKSGDYSKVAAYNRQLADKAKKRA